MKPKPYIWKKSRSSVGLGAVNRPLGYSDGEELSGSVQGLPASDIEERADLGLQQEFIRRIFRQYLTPRERRILSLYYGLDNTTEPLTLERIGAMLGVTRERVRQIRERAFEKLRRCPEIRGKEGFWAAA